MAEEKLKISKFELQKRQNLMKKQFRGFKIVILFQKIRFSLGCQGAHVYLWDEAKDSDIVTSKLDKNLNEYGQFWCIIASTS